MNQTALRTLVSTEALAEHLRDPDWVVLDCRHDLLKPEAGRAGYEKSHIPGARFMHLDRDLSGPKTGTNGRHPLPDPAVFARTLGAAGVDAGQAGRRLRCQDGRQRRAAVVDAALARARRGRRARRRLAPSGCEKSGPYTRRSSAARADDVLAQAPAAAGSTSQFVLSHLDGPAMLVLDARSPDRFRGENETVDPVGGRIPGSVNRFFRRQPGRAAAASSRPRSCAPSSKPCSPGARPSTSCTAAAPACPPATICSPWKSPASPAAGCIRAPGASGAPTLRGPIERGAARLIGVRSVGVRAHRAADRARRRDPRPSFRCSSCSWSAGSR